MTTAHEGMRQLLRHADAAVRSYALHYVCEAHDPGDATADDLWAALDLFAVDDTRRPSLLRMRSFAPTETSIARVIDALRTADSGEIGWELVGPRGLVWELPVAALRELAASDAISAAPSLSPPLARAAQRALEDELALAAMSVEELWSALESRIAELGRAEHDGSVARGHASRIVAALARSPDLASARGCEVLRAPWPVDADGFWRELLSVELFARVRAPAAMAPLVAIVADDDTDDYVADEAMSALVQIGSADVVAALGARMSAPPSSAPRRPAGGRAAPFGGEERESPGECLRTRAPDVLARIKRPESEATLLAALASERDPQQGARLAIALLRLCTSSRDALSRIDSLADACDASTATTLRALRTTVVAILDAVR